MNCPECQDILQRRLDGATIAPDAALEQHLAQCTVCRERHAAARLLLTALKGAPGPVSSADLGARTLALVLRDRERRRLRLRRSVYVTAALAASILLMLVFAYAYRPAPAPTGAAAPHRSRRGSAERRGEPEATPRVARTARGRCNHGTQPQGQPAAPT